MLTSILPLSLLLFIFLTRFFLSLALHLPHQVLSLFPLSLLGRRGHLPLVGRGDTLSHLSLYGRGGPLSLLFRLASVFNLYSTDFFFPRFSICTVLFFFSLYNHCC